MKSSSSAISYHFAVDDVEVRQAIPLNRNAWHAGDGESGKGNRKGIAIEICYSKSGGEKFLKAEENAAKFFAAIDSSCVYHNASTRFTDGGEFGMGAEIGISTDKLHARGPMGAKELTIYKYIIHGEGQIR